MPSWATQYLAVPTGNFFVFRVMWNTPSGQVCFPSGAFTSLLGHTILELTETLCQKRKAEYELNLLHLFSVARCIVDEWAAHDEYLGFNEEHCEMLDAIFSQLRVNIAQEIDSEAGDREEYFWRTKLYEAFKEVSACDPTVRKAMKIAAANGFKSGFVMLNLYPLRKTKPRELPDVDERMLVKKNLLQSGRSYAAFPSQLSWLPGGITSRSGRT